MRDSEILQVKTAVRLLGGMRDEVESWPSVKCPRPAYELVSEEHEAEKA